MIDIRIAGKQIELGEALQAQVREKLSAAVEKVFDSGAEANVTFAKERTGFRADCTLHLRSGVRLRAHGTAPDAYTAFNVALEHVGKQVRRYARRLKNHHGHESRPAVGAGSPE